ncbi:hypothetical protein [Rhizobium oryzicola]|uniref:Uncharacterized protein n=1 Tax=Rhizobium oryzicola TaxID=1232668 RepID=A0ABT8SYU1_9HYPH|nr:hypothetical protein [Rhizobium oryzicola]MDO1583600.1 hypothetical protein [Rhizobium oryzicola]
MTSSYEAGLQRVPGEAVAALGARFYEDERAVLADNEPAQAIVSSDPSVVAS